MTPTEMGVRTTPIEPSYTVYAAAGDDFAANADDVNDVVALLLARIERLEWEVAHHIHADYRGGLTTPARRRYMSTDPIPARSGDTMAWAYHEGSVLPL